MSITKESYNKLVDEVQKLVDGSVSEVGDKLAVLSAALVTTDLKCAGNDLQEAQNMAIKACVKILLATVYAQKFSEI